MQAERGIGVTVPASSANLGPGFDALAVALDRYLTVHVVASEPSERVTLSGEGAQELPTDERNRVWQALAAYCDWAGTAVPDVGLHAHSDIPLERGLGSSAAAAVAGVALGRALTGGTATDADLLQLAAAFDGHADNAAAALLGGLVVVLDGQAHRLQPSEALRPVVVVPAGRQSTEQARGLLPAQVPLAEAAANSARAALVVAGLAGACALDAAAFFDVLHEPARLAAMPATGEAVAALRDRGVPACLSGAGPSVLAVTATGDAEQVEAVRQVVGGEWDVTGHRWDRAGASVAADAGRLP